MASSEQTQSSESQGREVRGDKRLTIAIILVGIIVLGLVLWIGLTPELLVNTRDFSYTETPASQSASAPSITVTNVNGRISLASWSQNTVLITGRITSKGLGASPDQVNLSESNIDGQINVQVMSPTDSLLVPSSAYDVQISISIPNSVRFSSITVANRNGGLELRIENAANIHLVTVNGGVTINCAFCGNVTASTSNGPISATFSNFATSGQYTLTSVNGNIGLIVPAGSGFTFDATTSYGDIDISQGFMPSLEDNTLNHMSGIVNGGGSTVRLLTENGQITIRS